MDESLLWMFVHAFLAATVLPLASEASLLALALQKSHAPWVLWGWATAGNLLGSLVNYGLGRGVERLRGKRLFPVSEATLARARATFLRYGVWSLLLAWVPLVGDPLTVAAGVLRTPLGVFTLLVGLGKGARYGVLLWGVG